MYLIICYGLEKLEFVPVPEEVYFQLKSTKNTEGEEEAWNQLVETSEEHEIKMYSSLREMMETLGYKKIEQEFYIHVE